MIQPTSYHFPSKPVSDYVRACCWKNQQAVEEREWGNKEGEERYEGIRWDMKTFSCSWLSNWTPLLTATIQKKNWAEVAVANKLSVESITTVKMEGKTVFGKKDTEYCQKYSHYLTNHWRRTSYWSCGEGATNWAEEEWIDSLEAWGIFRTTTHRVLDCSMTWQTRLPC